MQNIDQMTDIEKIQAMEQLWQALTQNHHAPEPPEWHQSELGMREAKIRDGYARFTSLDQLKERGTKE